MSTPVVLIRDFISGGDPLAGALTTNLGVWTCIAAPIISLALLAACLLMGGTFHRPRRDAAIFFSIIALVPALFVLSLRLRATSDAKELRLILNDSGGFETVPGLLPGSVALKGEFVYDSLTFLGRNEYVRKPTAAITIPASRIDTIEAVLRQEKHVPR